MDRALAEAFHELGSHLDYPMLVVTAADAGQRAGCLVGFATQCAIDPPLFVVFISKKNFTYRVARRADHLGVHVLPADAEDLARLFGEETGDEVDKFARCRWEEGLFGVPVLPECGDRFVGRVIHSLDVADHAGFVLEPVDIDSRGSSFFSFQRAVAFDPGHEA